MAASVLVVASVPALADTRATPITHFGAPSLIALRGDGASAEVDFGHRSDELATRATLRLRYTYSTALAPASRIRVMLNGDLVGTLPVTAEGGGRLLTRELDFDPRLIVGWNKLSVSLAAVPGATPEDAAKPGLWAEVSGESELVLAVQPLAVADDLAMLPEPFFDRHDQRPVTIPFVFAAHPSSATLRAAAVAASWLGSLASWRGARFPPQLDQSARGHSIAFVTNAERPAFLASLASSAGPELRMTTNPADGRSKLLLVMGRDADDLLAAVDALASGKARFSGPAVQLKRADAPRAASPYVARAFVPLDRPVKLAEAVDSPRQLEANPVRVELRIPPDLAPAGAGVPLDLELRYTPPACASDASLDVSLNDEALEVLALSAKREPTVERRRVFIPASRLASRTELAFAFRFATDDACREARTPGKAAISPDSTIDFSGAAHAATMPNLNHFATVGFPFTRYADLSQAVVVLPERPAAGDIDTMLALMGRMGEATGEPATRVRVATPGNEAALADADLLVIGAMPQQALIDRWADAFPVPVRGNASPVSSQGMGPVAALYGFESPLASGRSVVVVTAIAPDQTIRAVEAMEHRDSRRAIRGSAAFVLADKVESLAAGRTYSTGGSRRPYVFALLGAALVVIAAAIVWMAARRRASWRDSRRTA